MPRNHPPREVARAARRTHAPSRDEMCGTKIRHLSQADANRHLSNLVTMGQRLAGTTRAYLCRYCRHWHVGRIPGGHL